MAKILELLFVTQEGKTAKISIDNPKEPVDLVKVKAAMTQIITANVFTTKWWELCEFERGTSCRTKCK